MEITKSNFKEFIPLIKDAIDESNFMAIDTELTGLSTQNCEHAFDSMDERYIKLRESAGKFLVIQYGLSCFKYHPKQKKYTHKDFNFYVFPKPYSKQAPDHSFMSQVTSLHYLASHGFDFNKLIHEGISFLTPFQEEKLKEQLKDRHEYRLQSLAEAERKNAANSEDKKECVIPEEHLEFIKDIHKQVDLFVSNELEHVLQLPPCNGYLRKLIYSSVLEKYPKGFDMTTNLNESGQHFITVIKANESEKREALQMRQIADINDLNDAVGFRKVLELITESKKLVIGHNMLLDILHTVNQFFYPLPESLQEFKEMTRCIFPRLIDTKTLASSSKFKDRINHTGLFNLLQELRSNTNIPTIEPADGFKGYDLEAEKFHEAGYDAFVTGMCYIGLTTQLAIEQGIDFLPPESDVLCPYVNRLFIMKHFDIASINLQGPDPEPYRDNVFYVTFPKEWRTEDLISLFSPYGNIYISWLNDTSALVALKNPEQKVNVHNNLLKNSNSIFKVKTLEDYKNMVLGKKASFSREARNQSLKQCDNLPPSKRRKSNENMENSFTTRSIDPIPEEEENEHIADEDKTDEEDEDAIVSTSHETNNTVLKRLRASSSDEPKTKKVRTAPEDESPEVSSTDKLFEEPSDW